MDLNQCRRRGFKNPPYPRGARLYFSECPVDNKPTLRPSAPFTSVEESAHFQLTAFLGGLIVFISLSNTCSTTVCLCYMSDNMSSPALQIPLPFFFRCSVHRPDWASPFYCWHFSISCWQSTTTPYHPRSDFFPVYWIWYSNIFFPPILSFQCFIEEQREGHWDL